MRTIRAQVVIREPGQADYVIISVEFPMARELSDRENIKRILDMAWERSPAEKTHPRPD